MAQVKTYMEPLKSKVWRGWIKSQPNQIHCYLSSKRKQEQSQVSLWGGNFTVMTPDHWERSSLVLSLVSACGSTWVSLCPNDFHGQAGKCQRKLYIKSPGPGPYSTWKVMVSDWNQAWRSQFQNRIQMHGSSWTQSRTLTCGPRRMIGACQVPIILQGGGGGGNHILLAVCKPHTPLGRVESEPQRPPPSLSGKIQRWQLHWQKQAGVHLSCLHWQRTWSCSQQAAMYGHPLEVSPMHTQPCQEREGVKIISLHWRYPWGRGKSALSPPLLPWSDGLWHSWLRSLGLVLSRDGSTSPDSDRWIPTGHDRSWASDRG